MEVSKTKQEIEECVKICSDPDMKEKAEKGDDASSKMRFNAIRKLMTTSSSPITPYYMRVKALFSLHEIDEEYASETLIKILDSLDLCEGELLDNTVEVIRKIIFQPVFDSEQRYKAAISCYNSQLIDVYNEFFSFLVKDVTVMTVYRVECAKFLFYSESDEYVAESLKYLEEVVLDHSLTSKFRYETIACFISDTGMAARYNNERLPTLYNEEFVFPLQKAFFFDQTNSIRNRLLSGQHLLQIESHPEVHNDVQTELLRICKDTKAGVMNETGSGYDPDLKQLIEIATETFENKPAPKPKMRAAAIVHRGAGVKVKAAATAGTKKPPTSVTMPIGVSTTPAIIGPIGVAPLTGASHIALFSSEPTTGVAEAEASEKARVEKEEKEAKAKADALAKEEKEAKAKADTIAGIIANYVHNIRADAGDILLRCGKTAEVKMMAAEIIAELGAEGASANVLENNFYTNKQNIHGDKIQQSADAYIEKLVFGSSRGEGDAATTTSDTSAATASSPTSAPTFENTYNQVTKLIDTMGLTHAQMVHASRSLNRISIDTAKFTKYKLSSSLIFCHVWKKITGHKDSIALKTRLVEELIDMADTCSSGHCTRLVNVLSYYEEDSIMMRIEDQLKANISARFNALVKACDEEKRGRLMVGIIVSDNTANENEAEREEFIGFLEANTDALRKELHLEFVAEGYMSKATFKKLFDEQLAKIRQVPQ